MNDVKPSHVMINLELEWKKNKVVVNLVLVYPAARSDGPIISSKPSMACDLFATFPDRLQQLR